MKKITYIDEVEIKDKTILLRVDFNVSLNPDHSIANDARIIYSSQNSVRRIQTAN